MSAARESHSDAARSHRTLRLPVWVTVALGMVIAVTGLLLITRPFASVGLLVLTLSVGSMLAAVVELVTWITAGRHAGRWLHLLLAPLLLALGVVMLTVPGVTVGLVAILFGWALIALGVADLLRVLLEREGRPARLMGGLAAVVFGVVALTWPDVTVLAIGALFGVWLLVSGIRLVLAVSRREPFQQEGRPRPRSWPRTVVSASALVVAVALALLGARLMGTPIPDAFYAPPAEIPDQPGVLLRAEPFTRAIPEGSTAWRILYTTTRDEGVPAISSGLVVVPNGVEDAPTIAWAHGTTGAAESCAPTLLPDPFVSGAMPNTEEVLLNGWAIVATDYVGLGADPPHPYLVGQAAARSVLDAVRASRQLADASLGDKVVVWGHSQGGAAALWTGGLAPSYAPELDIAGVAAMAPAANLPAMIEQLADGPAGTIVGPLVLAGYAAHYADVHVEDYLLPAATLTFQETVARCWSDSAFIVSVLGTTVMDRPIWTQDPSDGPLGARLEHNVPRLPIEAPLLLAQGLTDTLVSATAQQRYVEELCASGQQVDFRGFEGKDHMGVVTGDSPLLGQLMEWTQDRLDGAPPIDTC